MQIEQRYYTDAAGWVGPAALGATAQWVLALGSREQVSEPCVPAIRRPTC